MHAGNFVSFLIYPKMGAMKIFLSGDEYEINYHLFPLAIVRWNPGWEQLVRGVQYTHLILVHEVSANFIIMIKTKLNNDCR